MRFTHSRLAPAGLCAGAILFWSTFSQAAMDPKLCADALVAAMGAGGVTASYGGATASGNDVTITAVKAARKDGSTLAIDTLTFINPTAREPGGFSAERMDFQGGTATEKENIIKAASGSVEQAVVPSPDEVKKKARVTPFARVQVAGITATDTAAQAPVSIDTLDLTLGEVTKGVPHKMKLAIHSIKIDGKRLADLPMSAALIDDPAAPSDVFIDVGVETTYDSEKDTLTIEQISLSSPKAGNLTISARISGLPLSSLASSEKRAGTALSAKLDTATIRFENAGLVERLFDAQGKAEGKTRQQYVDALLPRIPDLLAAQFGQSDFQKRLADALAVFVKDPKSISVSSKPAEAVPVVLIGMSAMALAIGAPVDLSDVKDVEVKANQ